MAKKFIANLEAAGHVLTLRDKEAIRAASLLHDVAHRPFGHTLEDEGRVILSSHDNRALEIIENDEDLRKALGDLLDPVKAVLLAKDVHFPRLHRAEADAGVDRDWALWERAKKIWPDIEPFMGQIVGDTVCADLCDYLRRDAYYTGLRRDYDERVLKFLTIRLDASLGTSLRFLAFRIADRGVTSPDAVSEIVHLLNSRHALGARVYFHHHKMAFGAMICKAVRMLQARDMFQEHVLDEVGDEGFLLYLADRLAGYRHSCEGAVELARAVMERNHYYRAYVLTRERSKNDMPVVQGLIKRYRTSDDSWKNLLNIEKRIAETLGLKEHEVAVYCTDLDMQLKEAEVYVIDTSDDLRVLADAAQDLAPGLSSVLENHKRLWRFYVFIKAPSEGAPILSAAAEVCARPEVFGVPNTLEFPTELA
jgi:hypothetical protein